MLSTNSSRFRIESSLVYLAVAGSAVAYVVWRLELPRIDSWILAGLTALPIFAAMLGALFASWYTASDTGWFEILSVPFLVQLLACIAAASWSYLWSSFDSTSSQASSPSEWAAAATIPAFAFLYIALPIVAVTGPAASLLLRRRGKLLWIPNVGRDG